MQNEIGPTFRLSNFTISASLIIYTILLMQIFVLSSPLWEQKTANLVN